jgi:hypothetical protein
LKRLRSGKLLVRRVGEAGQEAPVTGSDAGAGAGAGAGADGASDPTEGNITPPPSASEVDGRRGASP